MKHITAVVLSIFLVFSFIIPCQAAEQFQIIHTEENVLGNGMTVITEIIDTSTARSTDKTYTNRKTIKYGETVIAIVAITATFRYDGTTVSVVSKSVSQSDTYDGWSYVQNSFTSSGGTVTLDAKLTKWFIFNTPFTMTLSCDKDGNISYT